LRLSQLFAGKAKGFTVGIRISPSQAKIPDSDLLAARPSGLYLLEPEDTEDASTMNPPINDSDQFFWEQFGQLRAKGCSPDEAADILLRAQKAVLEAFQKLPMRCDNGEPLTEQERPPCGRDNDADVNGRAQS
jgi:hypothetical protein